MSITHHLDDATLMSFAAGSLPAALAAAAASHAALCERCRREVAVLERVGGALMAALPAATLEAREPPPSPPAGVAELAHRSPLTQPGEIPWPIARLVTGGLDVVKWRWLGPGVWDHSLPIAGTGALRLLKVAPGHGVPEHGHGGAELTLVLRGAFHDETGRYQRGDIADLDADIVHQPAVTDDAGDCICLIASETPERFSSTLARHWQRVRGF